MDSDMLMVLVVLVMGMLGTFGAGFMFRSRWEARKKFGKVEVIGIDPDKLDVVTQWVRPGADGMLRWWRGKEDGEVVVGKGAALTRDGGGRVLFINRRTLNTYGVGQDSLEIAPDDGWNLMVRKLGIHERNVARSGGMSFLDELVKYTPLILMVFGIIIVVGMVVLSGQITDLANPGAAG